MDFRTHQLLKTLKECSTQELKNTTVYYNFDYNKSFNENIKNQNEFFIKVTDIYSKKGIDITFRGSNISRFKFNCKRLIKVFK
jgi:hypothetical protein